MLIFSLPGTCLAMGKAEAVARGASFAQSTWQKKANLAKFLKEPPNL